jgi:EamA-like transporter family
VAGLDELTATGFGFTAGGLVLLPLAAALGGITFPAHSTSLGLLALLGTGPTAVAYTLYFRGLRTVRASLAALLSLLELLTGTILARPAPQATARRTTPVAQAAVTAQIGTSTANACHTAVPDRVPAESTRAATTV